MKLAIAALGVLCASSAYSEPYRGTSPNYPTRIERHGRATIITRHDRNGIIRSTRCTTTRGVTSCF